MKKPPTFGKEKGAEFERMLSKRFSLWVSGGERKDLFWRTAGSGGRAVNVLGDAAHHAGDVGATSAEGEALTKHFMIEARNWKDLELRRLITRNEGMCIEHWLEKGALAKELGKHLMAIFKEDYQPTMLWVDGFGDSVIENCEDGVDTLCEFGSVGAFVYDFEEVLSINWHTFVNHIWISSRPQLSPPMSSLGLRLEPRALSGAE